jgi:hypothetical protein
MEIPAELQEELIICSKSAITFQSADIKLSADADFFHPTTNVDYSSEWTENKTNHSLHLSER